MPNLRHWTINTRNKRGLGEKGVDAEVIHDTMDFDQRLEPRERVRIRARLRAKYGIEAHDVVLFAGARIVPNKQTELAGHLTAVLQSLRQEIIGKRLYHGEVFSDRSRVVLVLAGRPERAFIDYQKKLFKLFDTLKIVWRYAGDDVRPYRSEDEGLYALYPDLYAMADFVLYLTGWEGFGNQLLEALAAELPVAVFEYPVFKEDIAPKGVSVVSLGDTLLSERDNMGLVEISLEVLTRAAREMTTILTSPEKLQSITDHNTMVGKRYFSFDVLRAHLNDAMHWARSFNS
jgi:glycosyltransferase involved in cell wall biosynthesis